MLTDRQHVPVVDEGGIGAGERAAQAHGGLLLDAHRLLEGIALDVLNQVKWNGISGRIQPAAPAATWCSTSSSSCSAPLTASHREIEEDIARRLVGLAFEILALVDAVERRLDDARVFAFLDLLLQFIALGAAGDVDQRRQPVESGVQLVLDRAWLDVSRPTDDQRTAITAFPGLAFLSFERRHTAIGEGNRLSPVVGGEDDNRVIELAHVLELLQHIADIVVHLLHAGFVDAPVLAAARADHVHVFVREHGRDVHARASGLLSKACSIRAWVREGSP